MDVTRSAGYSGRPYTLNLRVYTLQVSGNSSRYHHDCWGSSNSGYGSYAYSASTCSVWVAGDGWSHSVPNMLFGPSDFAGKTIGYGSGDGNWKAHNGSGYLDFTIRALHPAPGPFNTADTGDNWVSADRIITAPGQPSGLTATSIQPTQALIDWNAPSAGSSAINEYQLQVCTSASFSSGCVYSAWTGNSTSQRTVTGMAPGTTYYVRVRASNPDAEGPWSSTYSFTTLSSSPPGMTVVASPAGGAATVTLTPPGGVSSVTKYTVQWQYLAPTPIPSPSTWTQDTTSNTVTINGLVAGATYRWTATATIGSYTSPASANQDLTQPQPSTTIGDFFDGNTPAKTDTSYAWTGTTNSSTSITRGVLVNLWNAWTSNGLVAVMHQVTGGLAGAFSARTVITTGNSTPGSLQVGPAETTLGARAEVEPLTVYFGSIHVHPSHQQRMRANLHFYDATGTFVSTVSGTEVVAPAGQWTRLVVSGTVPATAETAIVKAQDVTGTGWTAWSSGDWIRADAAMVSLGELFPYFDGATADGAEYAYSWTGTANASPSIRQPVATAVDLLADPDCPPIPAAPRPPTVPSDCIADVGLWRRYWAYIPSNEVSDWLTTIPTLELTTQASAERQVRVRVYADPFSRSNALIDATDFCSEQIISYIPPKTTLTLDGVTERVWAEVNGGATIGADHLLYGSDGTPAVWPHLSCGIGYWASFDVPNESPSGNLSVRVFLTQRT